MNKYMTNAKIEFLSEIEEKKVKCAVVNNKPLKVGYSEDDFQIFLSSLDFEYDNGYGTQELFGKVWFEDDSWSERCEYDGSEWWQLKMIPHIPEYLK